MPRAHLRAARPRAARARHAGAGGPPVPQGRVARRAGRVQCRLASVERVRAPAARQALVGVPGLERSLYISAIPGIVHGIVIQPIQSWRAAVAALPPRADTRLRARNYAAPTPMSDAVLRVCRL
eukprot:2070816-Prymnesium_polylepis.1